MNKKVMVFGVFDGVHEGHRHFLQRAKTHGDYLVVVVARDEQVQLLKDKMPRNSEDTRRAHLIAEQVADEIILGDEEMGSWGVLRAHEPAIVAVGYDQHALHKALRESKDDLAFPFEIIIIDGHEPEKYHSSLLAKETGNGFPPARE